MKKFILPAVIIFSILVIAFQVVSWPRISIEDNNNNTVLIFNDDGGGVSSSGTGVMINDRYVITVKHITSEKNNITITFRDGTHKKATVYALPEGVKASDKELGDIGIDLAILKLDSAYTGEITTRFSCSLPSYVGSSIYTIGQPYGFSRMITFGNISILSHPMYAEWFVLNLAAYKGNSGGAVFDVDGGVIGILSAISMWGVDQPSPPDEKLMIITPAPITMVVKPEIVCDFMKANQIDFKQ